jgi:hypothetical protein
LRSKIANLVGLDLVVEFGEMKNTKSIYAVAPIFNKFLKV